MSWLAYIPFVQPLPAYSHWIQIAWAVPICAALSLVYKSIRCAHMRQVPREATVIFVTIIGGMVLAAAGLALLVKLLL
jgi:hypothetical protein